MPGASGPEDDQDPMREPRAYNRSILFMVFMPYFLLAGVGLLVWRECRKATSRRAVLASAGGPDLNPARPEDHLPTDTPHQS